jgi:hypothetical protein
MRRIALCSALLTLVSGASSGCDKERKDEFLVDIGMGGAVTERLPGIYAAVPRGDLEEMTRVGRWLDLGARALELATVTVVDRMGTVDADVVMPLVDIDPEGTSGQVVFIRWPNGKRSTAPLRVEDAQRWVMVAMMFGPDRVIDLELLQGEVPRGSVEERRIGALLVAAAELQRRAPKAAFYTVDRFQAEPTGNKKKPQRVATVVFALAQDDAGPDLELATDEPRKPKRDKRPELPPLVRALEVHPRGALASDPIVVALPDPHPLTVTRGMRSGRVSHVRAESGTYEIAADGTVVRMTPAP